MVPLMHDVILDKYFQCTPNIWGFGYTFLLMSRMVLDLSNTQTDYVQNNHNSYHHSQYLNTSILLCKKNWIDMMDEVDTETIDTFG